MSDGRGGPAYINQRRQSAMHQEALEVHQRVLEGHARRLQEHTRVLAGGLWARLRWLLTGK